MTDAEGTPLAIETTGANRNDGKELPALLDLVPEVKTPNGSRRNRPEKLHADKAYHSRANFAALKERGIESRIARQRIESSERFGRHRWVVERTVGWMRNFKRLTIRYERRDDIHLGFLKLAALIVAHHQWERFC